jgi:NADH-ubiquinone oxidoreductase chain 5
MDMGLSIGFFALFALFGSLDYATIFNLTPFMNETVITIIALLLLTGAMAKSAQIPLHSWLPGSMEGLKIIKFYMYLSIFILIFIYDYYYYDYLLNIQQLYLLPIFNAIHITHGNMLVLRRWFYKI